MTAAHHPWGPRALPLLLLAIGCTTGTQKTPGTDDSGSPWEEPARDDAYVDEPGEIEPPALDPDEIGPILIEALMLAREAQAGPAVLAFAEAMTAAEEGCPTWYSDDGLDYWFDACTTSAGVRFDGYGYAIPYVDHADGDRIWDGIGVYGAATIAAADWTLEAVGGASLLSGRQADGGRIEYSYLEGGFSYDGPAAEGTWLADGSSPELSTYGIAYDDSGIRSAYLSGRVDLPDGPVQAVVFEELALVNAAAGVACPAEPGGTASLLGPDGWYDVVFDGGWESPEACDGCATAWHAGVAVGQACADFSAFTEWDQQPWE